MNTSIEFRPYRPADKADCLAIFDANCPAYFAPNERDDYEEFLGDCGERYEICLCSGKIGGAFGLFFGPGNKASLNWILLNPSLQGRGIGRSVMKRIQAQASGGGAQLILIAASHKSAPFFARFGAREIDTTRDGWGPGMHRVDMELVP